MKVTVDQFEVDECKADIFVAVDRHLEPEIGRDVRWRHWPSGWPDEPVFASVDQSDRISRFCVIWAIFDQLRRFFKWAIPGLIFFIFVFSG